MSKNEQPSNENCYFLGAHPGFREALGRHWGGQGGHGLVLGLLWVSLAFLGGFWGLARGVLETQKGLFFHKYAYLIDVLITFSRDMASPLRQVVYYASVQKMLAQQVSVFMR